jgi:hypothetical protein
VRKIDRQPDVSRRWRQGGDEREVVLEHRVGDRRIANAFPEQVDADAVTPFEQHLDGGERAAERPARDITRSRPPRRTLAAGHALDRALQPLARRDAKQNAPAEPHPRILTAQPRRSARQRIRRATAVHPPPRRSRVSQCAIRDTLHHIGTARISGEAHTPASTRRRTYSTGAPIDAARGMGHRPGLDRVIGPDRVRAGGRMGASAGRPPRDSHGACLACVGAARVSLPALGDAQVPSACERVGTLIGLTDRPAGAGVRVAEGLPPFGARCERTPPGSSPGRPT